MLAHLILTDVIPQGDGPMPSDDFMQFIAVFPAFSGISETAYDFWHAQALLVIDPMEGCLGARYQLATWLLTAHYLTLQGLGSGAEAEMAAQGASSFTSIKSGTIELTRGASKASDVSIGQYGGTAYGRRLWPMLRACVGGPLVTGTGMLGCMPWRC